MRPTEIVIALESSECGQRPLRGGRRRRRRRLCRFCHQRYVSLSIQYVSGTNSDAVDQRRGSAGLWSRRRAGSRQARAHQPAALERALHEGGGGARAAPRPPSHCSTRPSRWARPVLRLLAAQLGARDLDLVALLVGRRRARSRGGTSSRGCERCFFVAIRSHLARAADSLRVAIRSSTSRARSSSPSRAARRRRSRSSGGATSARSSPPSRSASSATRSTTSR